MVLNLWHRDIGRALSSLPDHSFSYQSMSLLKIWHLYQALVRHFWKRWHLEYLTSIRKYVKWHYPTRNFQVGDLVTIHEDNLVPGKWPLARVQKIHPGNDGMVRVVTVKNSSGTYKHPVTEVALLLPIKDWFRLTLITEVNVVHWLLWTLYWLLL